LGDRRAIEVEGRCHVTHHHRSVEQILEHVDLRAAEGDAVVLVYALPKPDPGAGSEESSDGVDDGLADGLEDLVGVIWVTLCVDVDRHRWAPLDRLVDGSGGTAAMNRFG